MELISIKGKEFDYAQLPPEVLQWDRQKYFDKNHTISLHRPGYDQVINWFYPMLWRSEPWVLLIDMKNDTFSYMLQSFQNEDVDWKKE